jgi:hypothetical protein
LYMLNMILHMPEKYPLDMVVNFDLEIDWIWTKQVVDYMESRCKQAGIKFVRIKPRKTWNELYEKYDVPTRRCRWCNSDYKLDCKKQLNKWIAEQNCRPIAYIGFCADEEKRFTYDIGDWQNQDVCYPLAEEGITEDVILRWAKNVPLFNGWYKVFGRQGCMICPNLTRMELAYLCKYYPTQYKDWIEKIRLYEKRFDKYFYDRPIEQIDISIKSKWLDRLHTAETTEQMNIYDFI